MRLTDDFEHAIRGLAILGAVEIADPCPLDCFLEPWCRRQTRDHVSRQPHFLQVLEGDRVVLDELVLLRMQLVVEPAVPLLFLLKLADLAVLLLLVRDVHVRG